MVSKDPPPSAPGSEGVATRVLWARVRGGLTLRDAATAAEASASSISKLERGLAELSVPMAERLAKAYKVRAAWLAFGEDPIEEIP